MKIDPMKAHMVAAILHKGAIYLMGHNPDLPPEKASEYSHAVYHACLKHVLDNFNEYAKRHDG